MLQEQLGRYFLSSIIIIVILLLLGIFNAKSLDFQWVCKYEGFSSRVSHQSCHFLTAVQLLLQMVDGWLGRVGSILALYR